jgi:hypothetical protein
VAKKQKKIPKKELKGLRMVSDGKGAVLIQEDGHPKALVVDGKIFNIAYYE